MQEVGELLILEQYLKMLSPELQVWVKERNPESAAAAATWADVFVAARKKSQAWSNTAWRASQDGSRQSSSQWGQRVGADVGKPLLRENQHTRLPAKPPNQEPICYLCGQEGHTKPRCPKNPARLT